MAALWVIQEIVMIFMYYDFPSINESPESSVNDEHKPLLSNGGISNDSTTINTYNHYDLTRRRSSSRLSENLELAKGK